MNTYADGKVYLAQETQLELALETMQSSKLHTRHTFLFKVSLGVNCLDNKVFVTRTEISLKFSLHDTKAIVKLR